MIQIHQHYHQNFTYYPNTVRKKQKKLTKKNNFSFIINQDCIVSSVVFTGNFYSGDTIDSTTKWAFYVIIDRCHLSRYILLHKEYESNLKEIAYLYKRYLETVSI